MDIGNIVIWLLAIGLIVIAVRRGGDSLVAGLTGSLNAGWGLLPLLIGIFLVIGFSEVLLPRDLITSWLGGESGLRGILLACGLGAITPGGPFVSYPLVATLYESGAAIGPLVAFVTAWSLWSLTRLSLEFSLVGYRLTLIRLAASLIFPPLAGLIATYLVRWINF